VGGGEVQNATRLVDDVRYDDGGQWYIENRQRCTLCIKAYSRVKYVKCEKTFSLKAETVLWNSI
jgi:hypothetical protein